MQFVQQRKSHDCVIATISMFTGRDYDEVLKAAGERYDPNKGTHDISGVLVSLGYKHNNSWRKRDNGEGRAFQELWYPDAIKPSYWIKLFWGREAMFSVPSLNIENGWHMVCYDGWRILDPNPPTKKRYEENDFEKLEPRDAYVWQMENLNDV